MMNFDGRLGEPPDLGHGLQRQHRLFHELQRRPVKARPPRLVEERANVARFLERRPFHLLGA